MHSFHRRHYQTDNRPVLCLPCGTLYQSLQTHMMSHCSMDLPQHCKNKFRAILSLYRLFILTDNDRGYWSELGIAGPGTNQYHSLSKKSPWVEHLISLPKRGVGALSTVSALTDHERAPMSCLQQLKALEANNCTQNNVQWPNHQRLWSRILTVHNTLNGTMWWWAYGVAHGDHRISYVLLCKDALY